MNAFRHIDIQGCRFYSRPKMVADGIDLFMAEATAAGRDLPPSGYVAKEVMASQAMHLSNFVLPPFVAISRSEACGREIVDINLLEVL